MSAEAAITTAASRPANGPPPAWLQSLLYAAAEHLAARWNVQAGAVEFKAFAGSDEDATFRASIVCEPAAARFSLYVHHQATGRFVCRSVPVVLDAIDPDTWNTDLESGQRP